METAVASGYLEPSILVCSNGMESTFFADSVDGGAYRDQCMVSKIEVLPFSFIGQQMKKSQEK